MRKDAGVDVGDTVHITLQYDTVLHIAANAGDIESGGHTLTEHKEKVRSEVAQFINKYAVSISGFIKLHPVSTYLTLFPQEL